jgi:hypothetical protein
LKKQQNHCFPQIYIQPGENKHVISEDLSEQMLSLYRGAGIFASEVALRKTIKRLE